MNEQQLDSSIAKELAKEVSAEMRRRKKATRSAPHQAFDAGMEARGFDGTPSKS